MRSIHAEGRFKVPRFAIRSNLASTTPSCRHTRQGVRRQVNRSGPRVEPRSHPIQFRQECEPPAHPHGTAAPAEPATCRSRSRRNQRQPNLLSTPHADSLSNHCEKKRPSQATPYSRIRHPQPSQNRRAFGGVQCRPVDLPSALASTTGSFRPSLATLPRERKASQSLPALRAPVLNRKQLSPLRRQPRGLFRRACARGLTGVHRRAFLKRAAAFDLSVGTRCRSDVPAIP